MVFDEGLKKSMATKIAPSGLQSSRLQLASSRDGDKGIAQLKARKMCLHEFLSSFSSQGAYFNEIQK